MTSEKSVVTPPTLDEVLDYLRARRDLSTQMMDLLIDEIKDLRAHYQLTDAEIAVSQGYCDDCFGNGAYLSPCPSCDADTFYDADPSNVCKTCGGDGKSKATA